MESKDSTLFFTMENLRQATRNDNALIRSLAERSWNSAYQGIISQDQIDYMLAEMYSEEELAKHFETPDYHYFIIYDDEIPAGFIGFEHNYEPDITKLHRIYLIPEAKGKGLGKTAISFLKDVVKDYGNRRIILNVNKNNSARKVYESQGFKVYDEVVLDIGNGYVMDDYLMEFHIKS